VTALACAVLAACGSGGPSPAGSADGSPPSDAPTASPTTVPTRPAPTGTPTVDGDDGLVVVPQQLNGFAIAGQQVVLLVSWSCTEGTDGTATPPGRGPWPCDEADAVADTDRLGLGLGDGAGDDAGDGPGEPNLPVTVSATATLADATVLEPVLDSAHDVAEVVVVPAEDSTGRTVTVTVTGAGSNRTEQETVAFDVVEGEDDRAATAAGIRDLFVPWLAQHRPDLGITAATRWEGTMVSPQ
jgi:hypothetical protein